MIFYSKKILSNVDCCFHIIYRHIYPSRHYLKHFFLPYFVPQSCMSQLSSQWPDLAALRDKTWRETIFKIIAGSINIYIQLWSFLTWVLALQSANCNVLNILNCVLIREVFFNFQCIYFCCKKIIHNFLFAKNIQLI